MRAMKILVRVPNWIGDCVLAQPAIESIAANFPDAELWLCAGEWVKDLFSADSRIAGVVPLPPRNDLRGFRAVARMIKTRGFDTGVLLTNSFGSAFLFSLAGIPQRWGYAADGRRLLLTKAVRNNNRDAPRHQVRYYLDLLSGLSLKTLSPTLRLNVPEEKKEEARELLEKLGAGPHQPLLVLSPGAAYGPAKRWPASRFAELASLFQKRKGASVVLIGSPAESDLAAAISSALDPKPLDLTGRTTLPQLMAVVSRAHLFISNDSGPMHLANALRVPVVGIFGPTDPAVTGPFEPPAAVVKKDVPCWPCFYRQCPYDHRCMTRIEPEEVYGAAQALWR
ncbi:MAG: lipopolysaccharide heptosyltransferase [Candidatus Aminicenantes bacterium]|nr:lipopolysaccharide heptosyltransferase [Candidatus Aminicenantes bacterium]